MTTTSNNAAGTFTIETKQGLQNARKLVMKRSSNRSIYNVVIEAGRVGVSISPMGENKGVRIGAFKAEKSIAVVTDVGVIRINEKDSFAPFTKTAISVMFENTEKIHQYMDGGIYISYRGSNTKFYYMDGRQLRDMLTDESVDHSSVFKEDGSIKRAVRWYRDPGYTPSQKRKVQAMMFDVTNGNEDLGYMLDEATSGAYGIMKGKKLNLVQMIKTTARMFQWLAPSKEFGKVGTYAIYNGDWVDANGDKLWDGMSFIDSNFYASCVSSILGVAVSPFAASGEIVQNRPVTAKQLSVVVPEMFIRVLTAKWKKVHYRREDITPEIAQKIMDGGNGKGELANVLVVIGDSETPELLMDRNAIKADFDFTTVATLDVLDIAKASPSRTSMQMLNKLVEKDRKSALLLIKSICDVSVINDLKRTLLDRKPNVPSIKNFESDRMWLTNVVGDIAPLYATTKDKSMYRSMTENMVKGYLKGINKLKFELPGANLRLISDPSQMLGGENILRFGEVFSKEAERHFKKLGTPEAEWKVTAFKYPSIGTEEYYAATVVSSREMKRRIKELKATKTVKYALTDFFLQLSNSALVVPAIEDLKSMLAGMDFDYDGATVIFDTEFNRIMHNNSRPVIIKIQDDKKVVAKSTPWGKGTMLDQLKKDRAYAENKSVNESYEFGTSNFIDPFIQEMLNGNKSIGDVTNTNEIQIALSRDPEKAREILKKAFPEGRKDNYIGFLPMIDFVDGQEVDVYVVTPMMIDQIIEEIKTVKFTDANIKKIFFDLNIVYRFYQEKIIDAAKTGEQITVKVEIGRLTWAMSLTNMVGEVNWDKQVLTANLDPSIAKKKDSFQDLFFKVKAKIMNEVQQVMNEVVCVAEQKFETHELAMFQEFAHKSHRSLIDSMFMLKLLYNDVTGGYISRMEEANSQEAKNLYKEEYKADLAVLSAFARRLTADFSAVDRARIAKYVSMVSKQYSNGSPTLSLRVDGGSQFAALILPEEYLLMIDAHFSEVKFAGEELIIGKTYKEGDIVSFKHGVAEHDVVAADLNGEYEIKELNGRLYATKMIADLITIPEAEDVAPVRLKESSIKGRVDEVMELLSNAEEVLVYARTFKEGTKRVNDYALYIEKDGTVVKVAEIDTEGGLYNKTIDGAKAKVSRISRNMVNTKDNNKKESLIVVLKDLHIVDASEDSDYEPAELEAPAIEIEESDDLL